MSQTAAVAASASPAIDANEFAATLLEHLRHAQFVPTLLEAARIAERLGLRAVPAFVRNAEGRITGLVVNTIGVVE